MPDISTVPPSPPSRRTLLQVLAATAGGGALLHASASHAAAQMAQASVGYQDKPQGAQQCDNCVQFVAPSACKVVQGAIAPSGWCRIYAKKPA